VDLYQVTKVLSQILLWEAHIVGTSIMCGALRMTESVQAVLRAILDRGGENGIESRNCSWA
jgi:hypothetical protein